MRNPALKCCVIWSSHKLIKQKKGGEEWNVNVLPDNDALVLPINHHISVHVVRQSVDVRRVLILSLDISKRILLKYKLKKWDKNMKYKSECWTIFLNMNES